MTKEQVIETYLMNKPQVVAEMLYDTITRYEVKIKEYEDMILWMEENYNDSLCDYYSRKRIN